MGVPFNALTPAQKRAVRRHIAAEYDKLVCRPPDGKAQAMQDDAERWAEQLFERIASDPDLIQELVNTWVDQTFESPAAT